MSLSKQKYEVQPTFINLRPTECSQEFHYYPYTVKIDEWDGRCNAFNDISNKIYVPNNTEDLNLNLRNMITGINESKA